jgi:hypothetical protein
MQEKKQDADPRVIDYIKQKIMFWRTDKDELYPDEPGLADDVVFDQSLSEPKVFDVNEDEVPTALIHEEQLEKKQRFMFWASVLLIMFAQTSFTFRLGNPPWIGAFFLILGMVLLFIVIFRKKAANVGSDQKVDGSLAPFSSESPHWFSLAGAVVLSVFNFFLWRNSGIGGVQILVWLVSAALMVYGGIELNALSGLENDEPLQQEKKERFNLRAITADKTFFVTCLLAVVVVLAFQIYFARQMPVELVSQQVESVLAVEEIRGGSHALLFPRNVVSEPLGYYWYALFSHFFPAKMTLLSMNLANLISFWIGLLFFFFLTKRLFDKWIAIGSVFFFGIGFWPFLQNFSMLGNGLVFPFLVASLFFMFRGLEQERRMYIVLFGIVSGMALFAHKLFLMMPFVGLIAFIVYWLYQRKRTGLWRLLGGYSLFLLAMLIMALPFLATISTSPNVYFDPIFSRIGNLEQAIVGHPLAVFFSNFVQTMGIINWTNRSSWVDGISNRPALDILSATLFIIGFIALLVGIIKKKRWQWLVWLILIPLFMVPSAMSLAFPLENPSLSRAYGVAIPAFCLASLGLWEMRFHINRPKKMYKTVIGVFVLIILASNFVLLNNFYIERYKENAWNASEMAQTIKKFERDYGDKSRAWVLAYPHWVDERAVAIMAGKSPEALRINMNALDQETSSTGSKLFLLNVEAVDSLAQLKERYPNGVESLVQSEQEGKDYIIYLVP